MELKVCQRKHHGCGKRLPISLFDLDRNGNVGRRCLNCSELYSDRKSREQAKKNQRFKKSDTGPRTGSPTHVFFCCIPMGKFARELSLRDDY